MVFRYNVHTRNEILLDREFTNFNDLYILIVNICNEFGYNEYDESDRKYLSVSFDPRDLNESKLISNNSFYDIHLVGAGASKLISEIQKTSEIDVLHSITGIHIVVNNNKLEDVIVDHLDETIITKYINKNND